MGNDLPVTSRFSRYSSKCYITNHTRRFSMYCPSCGNEIAVELKYCNRCGANLSLPTTNTQLVSVAPVKLAVPSIVLGITTIAGLGIIFGGASELAKSLVPAVALVWIVVFAVAALFGCTALMIRFWIK